MSMLLCHVSSEFYSILKGNEKPKKVLSILLLFTVLCFTSPCDN